MDIVLYALTAFLYGGLAVAGWRTHRQGATPLVASVPAVPVPASAASGMSGAGRALLFAALVSTACCST